MAKLLAEADVCIQVLKKKNKPFLLRFHERRTDVSVSSVTVFELYAGAENHHDKLHRRSVVDAFLTRIEVVSLDATASREAGEIHGQLLKKGLGIGAYDVLNAGLARSRGFTIATNNLREHQRVPGLLIEQGV